jgi:hypothetical protein
MNLFAVCLPVAGLMVLVCMTVAEAEVVWTDGTALTLEGKGWTDTEWAYDRLPAKAKGIVRDPVWDLSRDSAGLRVRFVTDATEISVQWTLLKDGLAMPHMPSTGVSGVDLYAKQDDGRWVFVANGGPGGLVNGAVFHTAPAKEFALYLPLYNGTKVLRIGVPEGASLKPAAPMGKPVLFYGTSITQGGCASRPGLAAVAIFGRLLDVPTINLGFSGNGIMEPEMVDLLVETDPSVFVIDSLWNMSGELVAERVEPCVRKFRAAHPETPIVLAEDSSVRDAVPTGKGQILKGIYDKLTAEGMKGVYFVSAKGMLGTDAEGTVDGCHPNDLGFMRQAEVFARELKGIVGK